MEAVHERLTRPATALICFLLFFFNTFLLPQGFSLTLLLTPVWLYLLAREGRAKWLLVLLTAFAFYAVIHLSNGADLFYYALSDTMLFGNLLFCMAIWPWLKGLDAGLEPVFRALTIWNFLFCLLSLLLIFIPELKHLVWYEMSMSEGIRVIPRLKLFTYEASHYSYMLAPLFVYFASKALLTGFRRQALLLFMLVIPLLLSLSFGVLACLLISGMAIMLIYFRRVFSNRFRRSLLFVLPVILAAVILTLWIYYPENVLFIRLQNMLQGKDTSFRGRTYESFILADKIVAAKSWLWGIGPGQLKIEGRSIIVQYYYYSNIPEVIRIPNACAETIICFGYVGFACRILAQVFLAIYCRIGRNPFQLWLFLFLFLFQFAGSYITNWIEYVYWMVCFIPFSTRSYYASRQNGVKSSVS